MTLPPTLNELLKRNFVDSVDTVWHTHVSLVQPRGKFQFNRADLEDFWKVYCTTMESDQIPITGVAEKPHNYIPILVDIDLKVKVDPDVTYQEHLYTPKHVTTMIEVYQSILRNIVDSCDDNMLTCVLLEKPIYYITNGDTQYIKNGFHLHFPNLFLTKEDQNVHLFPRVKKEVSDMKLFADIGIADSETAVDACSCSVPWLLYGSRKSEDSEPYKFSKVFNSDCKEVSLEHALSDYSLYDHDEELIDVSGKVRYFLPRILSIVPYGRQMNELRDGLEFLSKEKLKKSRSTEIKHASVSAEEALKLSAVLMPMVADFRAEVYSEWMNIGWVLFNIGDGSSEALDQWLEFSQRSEKYDETKCIYEWERMVKKDKTIGTLKHFAKYDNPEAYDKWLKEQVVPLIKQSLSGSHNDIAKILFTYYGDEFRCASISGKTWFQFRKDQHRWEEIEEGVFLREHISNRLVKDYIEIAKTLSDEYGAATDKAHEAMIKTRKQQVDKLISNLKSASFKNSIMTEAQEVFYDRTFAEKLDQNPFLIGFKNGVYDLKLNFFRPGTQDDYISKTIAIEYREFIDADNEVEDVKDFLQKIFPDSSVRTYFLDTYSDIFVGGNSQKKVYMWTGNGDNGKSIVQEIFERMMGQLAIKFNTQYFTGKKVGTGSANPELSRAAPPIRHVTMEEPDADEQLNIGELKKLSGGDSYWARDLFEKGKSTREVFPMFTLTFICLSGDTSISLSSGVSFSLKNLSDKLHKTLSWDSENDGLVPQLPNKFLKKGVQNTVTLTLQDNRTITCTPDHKFLTTDNTWIEARDINIGHTNLKMGLSSPLCDDVFETSDYKNDVLLVDILDNKLKSMALCRIMGYMITDGSMNRTLYIGHTLDTIPILDDILLLTGKRPMVTKNVNVLQIHVPMELTRVIESIIPASVGPRVYTDTPLPEFLFDDGCPLFLIREFVASMFGGDGIVPPFDRNNFGSLQLVTSKHVDCLDNMIDEYEKLSKLLLDRFGIESYTRIAGYDVDKYHIFLVIGKNDSILKFCKNVGFRYCCHKMYRSEAVIGCLSYKNAIIEQNSWILERVREKTEGTIKNNLVEAIEEYKNKNMFFDDDYMINYSQVRCNYLHYNKKYTNTSVDFKKYLVQTGLYDFCNQGNGKGSHHYSVNKDRNSLPVFGMKVVGIKDAGTMDVFDLNMDEKYSNFIAEGIVTHNCNKLPKLKYSDKATWNRIRVIPFESVFVPPGEQCPETFEEQLRDKRFPMDRDFKVKIPGMIQAFAWYLLRWRQEITIRVEPAKVKEATAIYRKQNDIYRQFVDERILDGVSTYMTLTEMYAEFKDWFKESFPHMSLPIKNEVKEYFENLWGPCERGIRWHGFRIRNLQDDVESGDAVILEETDLVNYSNDGRMVPPL
jgi:phage/plasmid-associated DNA primase